MKNIGIVLLANKQYIKYFDQIYHDLRLVGKFDGDIIFLTDTKTNCKKIEKIDDKNLIIKRFEKIKFPRITNQQLNKIQDGRNKKKSFQWHKFYLFDEYFKNWDYIFYLDINMKIKNNINPLLETGSKNTLFAPFDGYPDLDWKLRSQFDEKNTYIKKLENYYNLENPKYFQTGILFFDTNIIKNDTFNNLLKITNKFPISKNNEQGIMNLYFLYDIPVFKRLPQSIGNSLTYSYWEPDHSEVMIIKKIKKDTV
tara:strand:- start:964 stop:1725 length:762 start_codon:yes stop_codon:yes gene_type:complete